MSEELESVITVDGRQVINPAVRELWRKQQAEAKPTSYAGSRARNAGYRLTVEEKTKLEAQLGRPVEDYAELKRIYREQGLRDLERGEPAAAKKDLIREWAKSGYEGPNPVGPSSMSMPKRPRESFEQWRRKRIEMGDRNVR
jgi:hypothetical protein